MNLTTISIHNIEKITRSNHTLNEDAEVLTLSVKDKDGNITEIIIFSDKELKIKDETSKE